MTSVVYLFQRGRGNKAGGTHVTERVLHKSSRAIKQDQHAHLEKHSNSSKTCRAHVHDRKFDKAKIADENEDSALLYAFSRVNEHPLRVFAYSTSRGICTRRIMARLKPMTPKGGT